MVIDDSKNLLKVTKILWPKEGVDFKCTASLCASEKGFARANNAIYQSLLKYITCDKVIGLDARGFIFDYVPELEHP